MPDARAGRRPAGGLRRCVPATTWRRAAYVSAPSGGPQPPSGIPQGVSCRPDAPLAGGRRQATRSADRVARRRHRPPGGGSTVRGRAPSTSTSLVKPAMRRGGKLVTATTRRPTRRPGRDTCLAAGRTSAEPAWPEVDVQLIGRPARLGEGPGLDDAADAQVEPSRSSMVALPGSQERWGPDTGHSCWVVYHPPDVEPPRAPARVDHPCPGARRARTIRSDQGAPGTSSHHRPRPQEPPGPPMTKRLSAQEATSRQGARLPRPDEDARVAARCSQRGAPRAARSSPSSVTATGHG